MWEACDAIMGRMSHLLICKLTSVSREHNAKTASLQRKADLDREDTG